MINLKKSHLSKQPDFLFNPRSIILFIGAIVIVSVLNIGSQIVFPSQNVVPYLVRTTISLIVLLALAAVNISLLKQNRLSSKILGLQLSKRSFLNVMIGVSVSIMTIILIMLLLYDFVPYHFVAGPLNGVDILKESYSYCLNSALEEFIFRGFLLVILSQLTGWRAAVIIMAVPFGLFHLLYTGFTMAGLKMVLTTAAYSFVFSYTYILTGSMWTSIANHISLNILLHAILGLGGEKRAVFVPVFDARFPSNYNVNIIISLLVSGVVAAFLFLFIRYREGVGK